MPSPFFVGEFEQLVLLAVLRAGDDAHALRLRSDLTAVTGADVSRGALYRTLGRLCDKGLLSWVAEPGDVPERGGHARRRFVVERKGLAVLRSSRRALLGLWSGLESLLD
jgi:PadR family transcriptional regulator